MEETQTIINGDEGLDNIARESAELEHKTRYGGRTEAQILSREPIKVQLGGKEYEIRPAVISVARKFAEMRAAVMSKALAVGELDPKSAEGVSQGFALINTSWLSQLDQIFAFASEPQTGCYLPREEIEDNATPEQVSRAYEAVVALADAPLAAMRAGA